MPNNNYFESRSVSDIQEELDSFRDLDIENLTINEIEETIGHLMRGHIRKAYTLNPSGLCRVRENFNGEIFSNTRQLWYPNFMEIEEEKWKFGRCNDKGESIFYASSETDTSICEIQPENNSFITMISCKPTRTQLNAIVQVIGVDRLSNIRDEYRTIFRDHYNSLRETLGSDFDKNLLIDNFITEQFTQIVNKKEDWKYKISIAITKFFIEAPRVVGIIYPSIAANSKGANFAFKPEFANTALQIDGAGMYEINNVTDSDISCRLIMSPDTLCTDGFGPITWRTLEISEMQNFIIKK